MGRGLSPVVGACHATFMSLSGWRGWQVWGRPFAVHGRPRLDAPRALTDQAPNDRRDEGPSRATSCGLIDLGRNRGTCRGARLLPRSAERVELRRATTTDRPAFRRRGGRTLV